MLCNPCRYTPVRIIKSVFPGAAIKRTIEKEINDVIGGVFVTTVKMALLHALWTWITLVIFEQRKFITTFTLASAIAGAVPIIPSFVVAGTICAHMQRHRRTHVQTRANRRTCARACAHADMQACRHALRCRHTDP